MIGHDLDSQAFTSPAADVDGSELAALDTLQDRLPRHAEAQPRVEHRQIAWRRVFHEAHLAAKERPAVIHGDHFEAPPTCD